MEPFVRRSLLLVPVMDREKIESSWKHGADAIVLDLVGNVSDDLKQAARDSVKVAIPLLKKGAAEVFVQVNRDLVYADVEASVWPGLGGIVYTGAEKESEIAELSDLLLESEKRRGIAVGTLQIIVMLSTGRGVWKIREIVTASSRVTSVGIDELGLCCNMGIVPTDDFDALAYAKGRLVIETRAAGLQPLGIAHPYGVLPRSGDADELFEIISKGKNLGFGGVVCLEPSWIEQANKAHTPTDERIEFYKETRRLFADAIARGTAAIPYPGTKMMIDVPVDERARITLELRARCDARDAEKAEAIAAQAVG